VAERAQVSPVTVSNVLRGIDSRASAETRERVLKAAREMNYIPVKPPSVQNRQMKTHIISLVFEHHNITHYDLDLFTYEGLSEGARKHGYDLLTLLRAGSEKELERQEVRYMDRRSDGFIFAISMKGQNDSGLQVLARNKVPTVVCYRRDVPEGVAWVDTDNLDAMQQAVSCLTKHGHSRIAYLGGPPNNYHEMDRHRGWREAMEKAGQGEYVSCVARGNTNNWKIDRKAIKSLLQLDVTAVVCFNDTLALELWDVAEEQGLKVPEDLSIIGVDNRPDAAQRGLSSIAHSFRTIGRLAVDTWVEVAAGGEPAKCCKLAPVELMERRSIASPGIGIGNALKIRTRTKVLSAT
jgi:DNA-binding LacI/PurR family transcriptional regulator